MRVCFAECAITYCGTPLTRHAFQAEDETEEDRARLRLTNDRDNRASPYLISSETQKKAAFFFIFLERRQIRRLYLPDFI